MLKINAKLILSIVIISIFFTTFVYAGEATIHDIIIDANILPNGDMEVKENLSFSIKGELNGLYRDVLLSTNSKYGASGIEVKNVKLNSVKFEKSEIQLHNGSKGLYNINNIIDRKTN